MTWISTFTGRQYYPLDPRADDVCVEDIAHHLAMLCRFTGACTRFYSVAEHSTHVGHVVEQAGQPVEVILAAHMHDAAEAYCNDIARPVKQNIVGYKGVELANNAAIATALQLPPISPDSWGVVHQADNAMFVAEWEVLMVAPLPDGLDAPEDMVLAARHRMQWANHNGTGGSAAPGHAAIAWLDRYHELRR